MSSLPKIDAPAHTYNGAGAADLPVVSHWALAEPFNLQLSRGVCTSRQPQRPHSHYAYQFIASSSCIAFPTVKNQRVLGVSYFEQDQSPPPPFLSEISRRHHIQHVHTSDRQVSLQSTRTAFLTQALPILIKDEITHRSLYRRSLKLALDWTVSRTLWRGQALYIRSLFDANRHVTEPRQQRVRAL